VPSGPVAAASRTGDSSSSSASDSLPFAECLKKLLLEFDDMVNTTKLLHPLQDSDIFHNIKTIGPSISSKFHCLDGEKLEAARKEFEQLEKDGIICLQTVRCVPPSSWCRKQIGSWRACGEFPYSVHQIYTQLQYHNF
jgi:hypothetical protein